MLLALLLILLGAILIVGGRSARRLREVTWAEAPHALAILGCCLFITLFLERIGYRLTLLFVLGFLFGVMERLKPWLALALTAALALGTFWLFDSLLRVPLPRGDWGF